MKIRVFKWSDSWFIQCPRCIYSRSFVAMASTHREAISKAYKHLHARHTTHRPYIKWVRRDGKPVGLCTGCGWRATDHPFSAAHQHQPKEKAMKTTHHLYTAEELRRLPPIEEEVAKALEKISDGAYIAAAQGRRFIICIVDKNIAYRVKQKLHALGYRVLVMEETKPDDDSRSGQWAGRWVELRVEWA